MIVVPGADQLRPCMDIVAELRALADRLEVDGAGVADVAVVVVSRRDVPAPEVYVYGRKVREAELSGLLLQAAVPR